MTHANGDGHLGEGFDVGEPARFGGGVAAPVHHPPRTLTGERCDRPGGEQDTRVPRKTAKPTVRPATVVKPQAPQAHPGPSRKATAACSAPRRDLPAAG